MKNNKNFIPVLIGADIGTYSIARTFYLKYQVKSQIFSKEKLGATSNSKIINQTIINDLNDKKLINALQDFAKQTKNTKKLLLACSEWYVNIILNYKEKLETYLIIYH